MIDELRLVTDELRLVTAPPEQSTAQTRQTGKRAPSPEVTLHVRLLWHT